MSKILNHQKRTLSAKLAFIIFFTIIFTSFSVSSELVECDKLAALKADPNRKSSPVDFSEINSELVVESCSQALKNDPKNADRYLLQRSRGHLRANNFEAFLSDLEASHKLGYPAAAFGLGVTYFLGENLDRDVLKSERLLLEAFSRDVLWSAKALAQLYGDPTSPLYDKKKSKTWLEIFNKKSPKS